MHDTCYGKLQTTFIFPVDLLLVGDATELLYGKCVTSIIIQANYSLSMDCISTSKVNFHV